MSQVSKSPAVNNTVEAVTLTVKSSGQTVSSLSAAWANSSEELSVEKNPFLEMSQDQIQKLDAVLSSEQAKRILSETSVQFGLSEPKLDEVLENEENKEALYPSIDDINYIMTVNHLSDLEPKSDDFLQVFDNSNEAIGGTGTSGIPKDILEDDLIPVFGQNHLENILLDHCYSMLPVPGASETVEEGHSATIDDSEEVEDNDSHELVSEKKMQNETSEKNGQLQSPVRRSQRQIEKIEREQLEKIKAENAELQRREKEEMERLKLLQENVSNIPESPALSEKEEEPEIKDESDTSSIKLPQQSEEEEEEEEEETVAPAVVTPKGRGGRGRGRGRGKVVKSDETLPSGKGRGRARNVSNDKETTPVLRGKSGRRSKDNKETPPAKKTKAESLSEEENSETSQFNLFDSLESKEIEPLKTSTNNIRGRRGGGARNQSRKKAKKNELYLSLSEDEKEEKPAPPVKKPRKRAGNQKEGAKAKGKKGKNKRAPKKPLKPLEYNSIDSIIESVVNPPTTEDTMESESPKLQLSESDQNIFLELANQDNSNVESSETLKLTENQETSEEINRAINNEEEQLSNDTKEDVSQSSTNESEKSKVNKRKSPSSKKKKKLQAKGNRLAKEILKEGNKRIRLMKKDKIKKRKEKIIEKKSTSKILKKQGKEVARKTYPKRENRKPPSHLSEIFEPALFSTPDIMKKIDGKLPGGELLNTPDSTEKLELRFEDSLTSPPITDPLVSSTENLPNTNFNDSKESYPLMELSNTNNIEPISNEVEEIKNEVSRIISGQPVVESVENEKVSSSLSIQEESNDIKPPPKLPSSQPDDQQLKVLPHQPQQQDSMFQGQQQKCIQSLDQQQKPSSGTNEKPKKHIRRLRTRRRKLRVAEAEVNEKFSDDSDISYSDDPGDSDWCSEDDPDRLWCVCKQPHNERFMILCDICKDWFHGTCVGVSRKQGREMEKNSREWICPRCTKEKPKAKEIKVDEKPVVKEPKENFKFRDVMENKPTKPSALEQRHLDRKEERRKIIPKLNKIQHQRERIGLQQCIVKCGKPARMDSIYCSNECIQKHANESLQLLNRLGKMKSGESRKTEGVRVVVLERSSGKILTGPNAPTETNLRQWLRDHPTFEVLRPGTALPSSKFYNATEKEKKDIPVKKEPVPVQTSEKDRHNSSSSGPEPIRLNVRKTLKDILTSRSKDADDILLSPEEVRKIVLCIEEELFKLFGDIGSKYKAKYRSLMFNIKDPKNHGLFRKILKGRIPPHKLVRMTHDELASKELAKWRERETKHALEIITREQSEIQQVPIIKKTHKGEIEIHEDEIPFTEDAPVEEKLKSKEEVPVETILGTMLLDTTEDHRSHLFDLNCKICTGQMAPPVEEPPQKKVKSAKTANIEKKKTGNTENKKKGNTEKKKTGDTEKKKTGDTENKKAGHTESKKTSNTEKKTSSKEHPKTTVEAPKSDTQKRNHHEKNESEKRVIIVTETPKETPSDREPSSTVISSPDSAMPSQSDADVMTPRSNQPSVWKGFIVMQEVAKLVAGAYKVSGPTDFLTQDVPDTIQICGRINASVVWDYLSKVKQSGTKEFLVIRFQPANDEEKMAYVSLYHYLSSRKRFGVVGNASKMVKDFYIVPLASHTPVPSTLQPFEGPGLEEPRPHMLLGVLVRHKGHRKTPTSTSTTSATEPTSILKKSTSRSVSFEKPEVLEPSFTPPLETMPKEKASSVNVNSPSTSFARDESSYTPPLDNLLIEKRPVVPPTISDLGDRSYTPPLDKLHQSSIVNADDSPYSPEKEALANDDDAPYDPEDDESELTEKSATNVPAQIFPLISGSVSTQSVSELIDQISKSSNPAAVTTTVLASIATATDIEQQRRLLIELTQKVEEQKHQLEMQKQKIAATVSGYSLKQSPVPESAKKLEEEEAYSPSYTPPLETENKTPNNLNLNNNNNTIDIKKQTIMEQDFNNISLPANLQKILENIQRKVSETNPANANLSDASLKSKNVILEDPIVKNFAHVHGDEEEKAKSFMGEISLEESSLSDIGMFKKSNDPRVKSLFKPADPRIKNTVPLDPRRKTGSSLSNMSVSELVEKARLQLEDTKSNEFEPVVEQPSAIPTIVSQSYPPALDCSNLTASYIEPPPPGVEEAEIETPAAFVPPNLSAALQPPTASPFMNPISAPPACPPYPPPPPPPPPPPAVSYVPPPFPPPSTGFSSYPPQAFSTYHNCPPPFNEQTTVHDRGSHRFSFPNRGRGRGRSNWHRDRERTWQSRDKRNSDESWHHDHDSRRPRDRDEREHYRDRDERRDRDDRHRDYRDRDERVRDKDYRDRDRGRDHKSRSRHRD